MKVCQTLTKLDDLKEVAEQRTAKQGQAKTKASGAKAGPARGWSKGTGFGGSHETSRKDEEFYERARAREVSLVSTIMHLPSLLQILV